MKTSNLLLNQIGRRLVVLTVLLMAVFSPGCRFFYKVSSSNGLTPETLQGMENAGKYFIFHDPMNDWQIQNLKIENGLLTGAIDTLPRNRYSFERTIPNRKNRYKMGSQSYILEEVHIYSNNLVRPGSPAEIPLNSIKKIELYNPDIAASTGSWICGALGLTSGILLIAGINAIVSYEKKPPKQISSCPSVFSFDGENYHFDGEIFGGAVSPPLERNDYLILPGIKPYENYYQILVSNLANEVQYTNLTELYVVDHPENTAIYMDKYGKIFSCSMIRPPLTAADGRQNSILSILSEADDLIYQSFPVSREDNPMDEIILTFDVPQKCKEAKLVIRARNSLFLDNMYVRYLGMFGTKVTKWQEKFSKMPAEDQRQWSRDQGIPLTVYLEKNGKWEFQDQFETPGPLALRDDILKLDLSDIKDTEIRIKLRTGQLFWEIDRVGIDFSEDLTPSVTVLKPYKAITRDSVDVLNLILADDAAYYIQPEPGDEAELLFHVPGLEQGNSRTIFLHGKGYYRILANEQEARSLLYMRRFSKPAGFTKFAMDSYFEIIEAAMN